MIDRNAYKKALDSGNRTTILSAALVALAQASGAPLSPLPVNVGANHGQDNSAERKQHEKNFDTQALSYEATCKGYNDAEGTDGATAARSELRSKYQLLELEFNCIAEIQRIDSGQGPGTGGGMTPDERGEPSFSLPDALKRLEAKLDKLLAK